MHCTSKGTAGGCLLRCVQETQHRRHHVWVWCVRAIRLNNWSYLPIKAYTPKNCPLLSIQPRYQETLCLSLKHMRLHFKKKNIVVKNQPNSCCKWSYSMCSGIHSETPTDGPEYGSTSGIQSAKTDTCYLPTHCPPLAAQGLVH